jgi:hypothetical protein
MISSSNFSIDVFHNAQLINSSATKGNTLRKIHLEDAMNSVSIPGQVLEFGVHTGDTVNKIAEYFNNDTIWGFDSFEGLPESWQMSLSDNAHPKGRFAVETLPAVRENVKLVKGWFNEVLPNWIKENAGPIKFLHMDADIYSSTKEVLTMLNSQIVPNTIIVFDEMYSWKNPEKYKFWDQGEYKALKEWMSENNREFVPLFRNQYMQCSIKITR